MALNYPETILCQLQNIQAATDLILSGLGINSNPTNSTPITKMSDPFARQILVVTTSNTVLTVPAGADSCLISVKGTGNLLWLSGATPTLLNSFSFNKDDIFKLESTLEMEKANFVSTGTNTLIISYYRTITA